VGLLRVESSPHSRLDRVATAGIALAALAVLAQIVAQIIDFQVYDLHLRVLDSNHHRSVFGAANLLAHGIAVLATAYLAVRGPRRRGAWALLSALLALLLVLRAFYGFDLFVAPLVAIVFVLLWAFSTGPGVSTGVRLAIRAGLVLLAVSFVVHVVAPGTEETYGFAGDTWQYQIRGIVKHTGSLGGWILIAAGTIALARRMGPASDRP
jgi:hypothetical protein